MGLRRGLLPSALTLRTLVRSSGALQLTDRPCRGLSSWVLEGLEVTAEVLGVRSRPARLPRAESSPLGRSCPGPSPPPRDTVESMKLDHWSSLFY